MRKFGDKDFQVDAHIKEVLKSAPNASDEGLRKNRDKFKEASRYINKEIGSYLYENVDSFIKASDSLRSVHTEFEELKTMLDQYNLYISSLQS